MRIGITERGDAAVHFEEWIGKLHTVDGAILITKNPGLLIKKLDPLPQNIVVHCTITGFGDTKLEPGVPSPEKTVDSYQNLVKKYGPEKIVLRVDPIIPIKPALDIARIVLEQAKGRTRISFIDAYNHTRQRMENNLDLYAEFINWEGIHAPLSQREDALEYLQSHCNYDLEICGEPGLTCTGCVSQRDLDAMGITEVPIIGSSGQRASCCCLAEKTELLTHRSRCEHGCLYCYWRD